MGSSSMNLACRWRSQLSLDFKYLRLHGFNFTLRRHDLTLQTNPFRIGLFVRVEAFHAARQGGDD